MAAADRHGAAAVAETEPPSRAGSERQAPGDRARAYALEAHAQALAAQAAELQALGHGDGADRRRLLLRRLLRLRLWRRGARRLDSAAQPGVERRRADPYVDAGNARLAADVIAPRGHAGELEAAAAGNHERPAGVAIAGVGAQTVGIDARAARADHRLREERLAPGAR